jgi:hypothetical protein
VTNSTYGYDSLRRRKARRAANWAVAWLRFRVSLILMLLVLAAGTITYDHLAHPGALTPPVHGHRLDATTVVTPSPVTKTARTVPRFGSP